MRSIAAILLAGVAVLAPSAALAGHAVFGPKTYARTSGPPPDTYTDVFVGPSSASYLIKLINGDDDGAQAAAATIALNGVEVLGPEIDEDTISISKTVTLIGGQNTLTVAIDGDPGAFIAVTIVPLTDKEPFITGRLILPYGSISNLQLELHNSSPGEDRSFSVLFFNPDGSLGAESAEATIAPRASVTGSASSFASGGSWTEGAVEIVYTGRAGGKLFGQAAMTDSLTGITSVIELQKGATRTYQKPLKPKKKK